MKHPYRPTIAMAAVAILAATALVSPAQASSPQAAHQTWQVHPGVGTISSAVAKADAGDTLILKKGTFFDSVTIDKTLTIEGAGWSKTIITPPKNPKTACQPFAGATALCVVGVLDSKGKPDVTKPVKNVRISELRLKGFDNGVFGFNTKGLNVNRVRSHHNAEYGIAAFSSTRSDFSENWTSWNGDAGLYLGDSPNSRSVIRDNRTHHNGIGVFMRDSTRMTAADNRSWGNCIGILALSTHPQTPAAGRHLIKDNTVRANNKACPKHDGVPAFSGIGIALAGVHHVVVLGNDVSKNDSDHASKLPQGGIVVFSTRSTVKIGGTHPKYNLVVRNRAFKNQPADIHWDETGVGNRVRNNECEIAIPDDLGWCTS